MPADEPEPVTYLPIGVVCSPYTALDGMPLQTVAATEVEATVALHERVHGALRDLDGFSHLWLLVHLHRVDSWAPEVVPFLDDERPRGVLATRSPRHPNRSACRSSSSWRSSSARCASAASTSWTARRCSTSSPTCRCSTRATRRPCAPAGSARRPPACTRRGRTIATAPDPPAGTSRTSRPARRG